MAAEVVCLDTAVLIYWLERNPLHHAQSLRLMEQVEKGAITGVTSALCLSEVLVKPYKVKDRALAEHIEHILTNFPNLAIMMLDSGTARLAAELRGEHGLKLADSVVAATALISGCARLVTNDRDMKKIETRGIKVEIMGKMRVSGGAPG
jgi:predicted nucleic acid-binding protein